ncbi:sn-glycerol-3-phosphate ABC transporter ATP-binding protein UgpC [Alginatibacterium sediminis]|uniref:sn-glycerol-3-phosphate ABC transporter ATP-binding protein UgpC n=1 Tax=Alginatibacterium sediminis TaxID=2164068 RepID=A0A420EBD8_9ALTE|nr:sn-glycerol-3-phosphate ABC transporter ATP-binding protein UgpC [Alginatibacterium sediminis]RKF17952.1 sn-glycerol-3-phosphate ABC transporter ATP-binding protein UgpC [Alginatibacterium sediminis]
MATIKLDKLFKRYGHTEIIHGVDLDIKSGEFTVFVGPSGCGKSTLLRMIAGLEDISAGELYIDNELVNQVDPSDRGVSMVFQSYALYPHMTVAENMGFGLKMSGKSKDEINKFVQQAADTLQLGPLLKRKPKELSGGQRQRVAIGRAIVRDPKVFLFDEPLSNLDAELRVEMRLEISRLHQKLKNTMVYVTHDQVEAMTLADNIVVLRDGYIEQVGSPIELYNFPDNLFVAGFIGSPRMNFVPVTLSAIEADGVVVNFSNGQSAKLAVNGSSLEIGKTLTFGIRPEHIHLDIAGDFSFDINVEAVERLGNSTFLFGEFAKEAGFKVHIAGDKNVSGGSTVKAGCDLNQAHLFDNNGLRVRSLVESNA